MAASNLGDINNLDALETQMHQFIQTIRYKLHTLVKHWSKNTSSESDKTDNREQWIRILDTHFDLLNRTLDTALNANGIPFDEAEYQRLEREYHKELFSTVTATNPMWLSLLLLLSGTTQPVTNTPVPETNDTLQRLDNYQTDLSSNQTDPDFRNDYNELSEQSETATIQVENDVIWDTWGDWEMINNMTPHMTDAINRGKIKID